MQNIKMEDYGIVERNLRAGKYIRQKEQEKKLKRIDKFFNVLNIVCVIVFLVTVAIIKLFY